MPHFQLVTTDGDTLGPVHLAGHDWQPATVIHRGEGVDLRVVDVVPCDDDPEQHLTVLVVEPTHT